MSETMIGIKSINRWVLVGIHDDGEVKTTLGGKDFFLLGDNDVKSHLDPHHTKHRGIRPRWGIVLSVPDAAHGTVRPGQKILMEHGKWTQRHAAHLPCGVAEIWAIDYADILGVTDEPFTEQEREKLDRMYEGWEDWAVTET